METLASRPVPAASSPAEHSSVLPPPTPSLAETSLAKKEPIEEWERQAFHAIRGYREGRPVSSWLQVEKDGFLALWVWAKRSLGGRPMPVFYHPEGIGELLETLDEAAMSQEEIRSRLARLVLPEDDQDEIWLLRDAKGRSAQKTYVFDEKGAFVGSEDFPNLLYFEASPERVDSLRDLLRLFDGLDASEHRKPLVIRGVPEAREGKTQRFFQMKRRIFAENQQSGLIDVPQRWFALDIDKEPLPPDADLSPKGLHSLALEMRSRLPEPLRSAECLFSFSGSTGIKKTFGLHLWFWNKTRLWGADLKHWLKEVVTPVVSFQGDGIDDSLYSPDHPLFVASPRCLKGAKLQAIPPKKTSPEAPPSPEAKPRFQIDPKHPGKRIPPPIAKRRGLLEGQPLDLDLSIQKVSNSASVGKKRGLAARERRSLDGPNNVLKNLVSKETLLTLPPLLVAEAKQKAEERKAAALDRIKSTFANRFLTLRSAAYPLVGYAHAGLLDAEALQRDILEAADSMAPENWEDNRRWLDDAFASASPMWPFGAPIPLPSHAPKSFVRERLYGGCSEMCHGIHNLLLANGVPKGEKATFLLHWSLGTGKTEAFRHAVIEARHAWELEPNPQARIVAVSPLQSLTAALGRRLGLDNYQDSEGTLLGDVAVTLHSIGRVKTPPTVLIIDEIEQVRAALASELFVGQARREKKNLYDHFVKILQGSQIVLLGDAFVSEATRAWLDEVRPDGELYVSEHLSLDTRDWIEYECEADLVGRIMGWVSTRQRFVVGLNSIKQTKMLAERIRTAWPGVKLLCYHSKNTTAEKATLENVNASWKEADIVLFSPSVSSGVSFDVPDHFERMALLWPQRVEGLGAEAFFQQALRLRSPKFRDVHFHVSPQEVTKRKPAEEIEEEILGAIADLPEALIRRLGAADALLGFKKNGRWTQLSNEEIGQQIRASLKGLKTDDFFSFLLATRQEVADASNAVRRDIRDILEAWEQPHFFYEKASTKEELKEFRAETKQIREEVITAEVTKTLETNVKGVLQRLEAETRSLFESPAEAKQGLERAAQRGDTEAKEVLKRSAILNLAPGYFSSPDALLSKEGRAKFVEIAKNPQQYIAHRRLLAALQDAEFSVKNQTWRHRETKAAKDFARELLETPVESWFLAVDPRTTRLASQNLLARTMRLPAFRSLVGDAWNPDSWKEMLFDAKAEALFVPLRDFVLQNEVGFRRIGLQIGLFRENMVARATRNLLEVMGFRVHSKQRQKEGVRYTVSCMDRAYHERMTKETTAPAEFDEESVEATEL